MALLQNVLKQARIWESKYLYNEVYTVPKSLYPINNEPDRLREIFDTRDAVLTHGRLLFNKLIENMDVYYNHTPVKSVSTFCGFTYRVKEHENRLERIVYNKKNISQSVIKFIKSLSNPEDAYTAYADDSGHRAVIEYLRQAFSDINGCKLVDNVFQFCYKLMPNNGGTAFEFTTHDGDFQIYVGADGLNLNGLENLLVPMKYGDKLYQRLRYNTIENQYRVSNTQNAIAILDSADMDMLQFYNNVHTLYNDSAFNAFINKFIFNKKEFR